MVDENATNAARNEIVFVGSKKNLQEGGRRVMRRGEVGRWSILEHFFFIFFISPIDKYVRRVCAENCRKLQKIENKYTVYSKSFHASAHSVVTANHTSNILTHYSLSLSLSLLSRL